MGLRQKTWLGKRKVVSIRLPLWIIARLDAAAERDQVSLHGLCQHILSRYACRDKVLRLAELPEEQRLDALLLGLDWDEREPQAREGLVDENAAAHELTRLSECALGEEEE